LKGVREGSGNSPWHPTCKKTNRGELKVGQHALTTASRGQKTQARSKGTRVTEEKKTRGGVFAIGLKLKNINKREATHSLN